MAYPIGGDRGDKYILIEIHYDNPNMESGYSYICYNMHIYIYTYCTYVDTIMHAIQLPCTLFYLFYNTECF